MKFWTNLQIQSIFAYHMQKGAGWHDFMTYFYAKERNYDLSKIFPQKLSKNGQILDKILQFLKKSKFGQNCR